MIRTYIVDCKLKPEMADALNLRTGNIYNSIVTHHWRLVCKKDLWLSEKAGKKLSDLRVVEYPMHAHTIDAAQEGFYKACNVTRAVRKAAKKGGATPEAVKRIRFPYHHRKFRTTIWKNTAIKVKGALLILSNGLGNPKIEISLPKALHGVLSYLEVRLVFDKKARKYTWHIVAETGKQPKQAPGTNTVSVDPGEIHPAVVGDEQSATIITCRERRAVQRGHAKNLKGFSKALARKKKGSRRYKKLIRAKSRCKAKYNRVMRDIEHKVSRAIVDEAVERKADTLVYGDIRDLADGMDKGKEHNQRTSQWAHGKVRQFVEYKAEAEGIKVVLQDEHYTSKTCPNCEHRHKPRGRNFKCPACKFQSHRDVVGQTNILSAYKFGAPGKIPTPTNIKYRIPQNMRVLRKRADTPQAIPFLPVAWQNSVQLGLF